MPETTVVEFLVTTLTGGAVGLVAGVFGVGGGFLLVPVLHVLLGVPVSTAVGAGTCQALGPSTTALLYRRPDRETLRLPFVLFGGLFVGVLFGGAAHAGTESAEHVVLVVYLVLLLVLAVFVILESWLSSRGRPLPRGWLRFVPIPPYGRFPDIAQPRLSLPVLVWFGLGVGYLSGLLGISGGLVLLPAMVYLFGVPAQDSVRCSLVVVWLVSVQATAVHAWNGNVDLWLVSALMLGGTVGARLGSAVGSRLGGTGLRLRFGILLLAAAGLVAFQLFRPTT